MQFIIFLFLMQETTTLFCTISLFITWITGRISKKMPWFENYLIPIQNMLIGLSIAITEWFFTHDFNLAIAVSGIAAGGIYDVFHNLNIILKILINNEEKEITKEKMKAQREEDGNEANRI